MQRCLLPDAILVDAGELRRETALLVDGARIAALVPGRDLPSEGGELTAFPGELWAAAPILTHAHLESFDAPAESWPRDSFSAWVSALLAWREQAPRWTGAESAAASLRELADGGCGLVVSHVGEGDARSPAHERVEELPELWALPELFAPDGAETPDVVRSLGDPDLLRGVALHAPYSVSEELARQVFHRWTTVSVHLGEHDEERRFLRDGDGPLAALFEARGRSVPARRWSSAVDWLAEVGGLRPGTLAVHGGELNVAELQRLRAHDVAISWCPGTHAYFERPRPAFLDAGWLPSLGCDSRASNAALDPLRELRLARSLLPDPGPQEWWRSLTERGAAAVQREDLGSLRPGRRARILRMPWPSDAAGAMGAAETCDRLSQDPHWASLGPAWEPS